MRQLYNNPVQNSFEALEMDQEIQAGTTSVGKDLLSCPQDDREPAVHAIPVQTKTNKPAVLSTSNTVLNGAIQDCQYIPDPVFTDMDTQADNSNQLLEFQKCKEQIGTKFGCVPLTPIDCV